MQFENTLLRLSRFALYTILTTSMATAKSTLHAQLISRADLPQFVQEQASYRRYTTPMQCLRATRRELRMVWRSQRSFDTAAYPVAQVIDTFPTRSIEAARQCMNALQVEELTDAQRVTLVQLALRGKQDVIADSLLQPLIQARLSASATRANDWILKRIGAVYVSEKPIRVDAYEALIEQLNTGDSLKYGIGSDLRDPLRTHFLAMGNFSAAANESRTMLHLLDERWGPRLQGDTMTWLHAVVLEYFRRLHSDLYLSQGIESAQPVVADMRAWVTAMGKDPENPFGGFIYGGWSWVFAQNNQRYIFFDSLFGHGVQVSAPTMQGDSWFRRVDTVQRPAAGRVTLIILGMEKALALRNFDAVEGISVLRRLHDQYSARGLEIVYAMCSRGFFRDSPVLTFEQEGDALASALFDYFKAPGMITLERTEFFVREDGKRIPELTPNYAQFRELYERSGAAVSSVLLVDRHGNLSTTMQGLKLDRTNEATLARLIDRAINEGERTER